MYINTHKIKFVKINVRDERLPVFYVSTATGTETKEYFYK
jgi:hypothetical protein